MSDVYLGRDEILGRPVAVKLLKGGLVGDKGEDIAARFQREGRTAARLSHAGIVPVYDAGEAMLARPDSLSEEPVEVSYIVMEYVSGGDLGAAIEENGPLGREDLVRIGSAAADALAHAHGRGIVHRDIKPQNILIDHSGRPKLADFGIARALEATQATRTGQFLGTALYAAPEQLRGEKVGGPTDVYALGVTLYHAATGRPPFQGTMLEVAQEHLNSLPVPPHQRIPGLDRSLSETVLACLAKDPADRPTAEELSGRLLSALGGGRPGNLSEPSEAGNPQEKRNPEPSPRAAGAAMPVKGADAERGPGGPSGAGPPYAGRTARPRGGPSGRRKFPVLLGVAAVAGVFGLGGVMAFNAMSASDGPAGQNPGGTGEARNIAPDPRQPSENAARNETAATGDATGEPATDETATDETATGEVRAADGPDGVAGGFEGEAASRAPAGDEQAGGGGSAPGGGSEEQAVETVRLLYSSAVAGDYATSYGFLTDGMKQTYAPTEEQWSGQFETLRSLEFVREPEVEVSGEVATVSGVTRAEHTDRTELNTAVWTLLLVDGEWRLDNQSILQQELV